jgi:hypothetical protein
LLEPLQQWYFGEANRSHVLSISRSDEEFSIDVKAGIESDLQALKAHNVSNEV